ncbi:MAG: YebC/PmpR family DNA-binding transcriptional regulator [Christensenellaceae bacterium]|nr:YebC/PmpR family DNA-binding transcriptional regulator [Christensenellaceae bacterium]
MSGHNKWSTIKNKKGKADAARGKIFTKIGRELAVAVKLGGSDPASNSKLRDVIAKAKANNMPNDNINRSIKKAAGELGSINYEELVYEGYGPGGVAVIVNTLSDNKNRTASDVRHAFDKSGGSLGATNCVGYMFDKKGVIVIENDGSVDEEELMMSALDAGAEDFDSGEEAFEITTAPDDFSAVREALESAGYTFASAEIDMIPQNTVTPDEDTQKKLERLFDMLDDLDDVQDYFHNAEM